jgi:hypothetical protein
MTGHNFNPALTREMRRAVCVHEAGHAVMFALGGAWVYRVAVAPEGATEWSALGRKGAHLADLWGVCCPSDSPGFRYVHWDEESGDWGADLASFLRIQNFLEEQHPGSKREGWRQVRAHVCGSLGGPAAEQIHDGVAPWLDSCGESSDGFDDAKNAQAHAWLLPWRGELEHPRTLTVQTLKRPEVWALVIRLADALELAGDMENLTGFLPAPVENWAPSLRARRPVPFAVALMTQSASEGTAHV